MRYAGFYVNLDRCEDRRIKIEQELANHGLGGKYTRFSASDGNAMGFPNPVGLRDSELGCFTSHYRLLKENRGSALPLHVMEDDIVLSKTFNYVMDQVLSGKELDNYDILYTDISTSMLDLNFVRFKQCYDQHVKRDKDGKIEHLGFTVVDLSDVLFCSTCSFIVNPKSIDKLLSLYETELKNGARGPIDIYLLTLCQHGQIKAGTIFPFITSVPADTRLNTTVHNRSDLLTVHASILLRRSFYADCNLEECAKEAAELFPQPDPSDPHCRFLMSLTGFLLSGKYTKV
ncbi:MAG: glycosyltransferase family 25 protein [Bdellovibrionales bacterium]